MNTTYEIRHRTPFIVASILHKYLKSGDKTILFTAVAAMIALVLFISIVESIYDY